MILNKLSWLDPGTPIMDIQPDSQPDGREETSKELCSICLESSDLILACDICKNRAHRICLRDALQKGSTKCKRCSNPYSSVSSPSDKNDGLSRKYRWLLASIAVCVFLVLIDPNPYFDGEIVRHIRGASDTFQYLKCCNVIDLFFASMITSMIILTFPLLMAMGIVARGIAKLFGKPIPPPYNDWVEWPLYYVSDEFLTGSIFIVSVGGVLIMLALIGWSLYRLVCMIKRLQFAPELKRS